MADAIDDLTEKEKETLRLIVRGHDAKSAANELGLSVHTINERLRSARRKLTKLSNFVPISPIERALSNR